MKINNFFKKLQENIDLQAAHSRIFWNKKSLGVHLIPLRFIKNKIHAYIFIDSKSNF